MVASALDSRYRRAQPRGSASCMITPDCFVSSDQIVWAMHGGNVVAIAAIAGRAGFSFSAPMELAILKRAAPNV